MFRVTALSSTSLKITWSNVPEEHRNGVIIGYDVIVYDVLKNTSENITVNEKQFQKYGLKKYYNYSICVSARTSIGRGNCSA